MEEEKKRALSSWSFVRSFVWSAQNSMISGTVPGFAGWGAGWGITDITFMERSTDFIFMDICVCV